jgi:drug/metabolite transporter (DMT)-like permease
MALGVAAWFLFSLHDASNKWLVATLPAWQILFFRSLFILTACLAVGRRKLVEEALASPMKRPLALRAALTLTAWLCYYSAARYLPLAQMLTLYFSAPILITAMSAPLLGEKVTKLAWLSVLIGFCGVLVATDPFGVELSWPTLLVLIAACFWGYGVILMRQIARLERTLVQMLVSNLISALVAGTISAFTWVPMTPADTLLIVAVGVFGGGGQFLMFEAARRAPAVVMATVEYSALLWAFILGFLIWHDVPTIPVWTGAALILLAAGVMLIGQRRPQPP